MPSLRPLPSIDWCIYICHTVSLPTSTLQVPSLLEEVLDQVSEPAIGEAVKYYQGFTAFAHSTGPNSSLSPTPTLVEVREGTTQVPAALLASQHQQPAASSSKEPQIEWDLDAAGPGQAEDAAAPAAPADISWDIELPAAGDAAGGIDWDLDAAALEEQQGEAAGAADESAGAAGGISWDIEITDAAEVAGGSDAAPVHIDWDIEADAAAEEAGAGQSGAADLSSALDQLAGVSGAAAGEQSCLRLVLCRCCCSAAGPVMLWCSLPRSSWCRGGSWLLGFTSQHLSKPSWPSFGDHTLT
jgi:hypothetical protein